MSDDWRKRPKDAKLLRGEGLPLDVSFVPLCGPVVRCPSCGLAMVPVRSCEECEHRFINDLACPTASYCVICPECGILG